MKRMMVLFLLCGWLLLPTAIQAQDDTMTIGTRHRMHSAVLGEERAFWVSLPEGYREHPERKWPVLYLLDGDVFFLSVTGFTRFFAGSDALPCVVVAVLNVDRTRDFTPTCSVARRDGTVHPEDRPAGGEAARFRRFLTEELRAEVQRLYPHAGSRNYLFGHSYAGLFTLCTLLDAPDSFDAYVAVDPSLWWDQGYVLKHAAERARSGINLKGKRLYTGFATQPRPERGMNTFPLTDAFLHEVLPQLEQCGLHAAQRKFPEEVHGTVALPGFYDGLKQLFPRPKRVMPEAAKRESIRP